MEREIIDICRTINSKVPDDVNVLLFDEGYIDSFGAYAILVQLELKYAIKILEEELKYDNFKSVKCIMELVQKKRAEENEKYKK